MRPEDSEIALHEFFWYLKEIWHRLLNYCAVLIAADWFLSTILLGLHSHVSLVDFINCFKDCSCYQYLYNRHYFS